MESDHPRRNGVYIKYQRLTVRGWGQKRLIQEMRATAARLGEEQPGVTVPMVSNWENGKQEPVERYWRLGRRRADLRPPPLVSTPTGDARA